MLKLIDRLAEWWLRRRPTIEPIEIHVKNGVFPKSRIRSGDSLVIRQGEMSLTDGMDMSNIRLASLTVSPTYADVEKIVGGKLHLYHGGNITSTTVRSDTAPTAPSSSPHCPSESPAPQS